MLPAHFQSPQCRRGIQYEYDGLLLPKVPIFLACNPCTNEAMNHFIVGLSGGQGDIHKFNVVWGANVTNVTYHICEKRCLSQGFL